MIPFGKDYIYVNGEVYKKVKPDTSRKTIRWKLEDKKGNRHWISKKNLETIVKRKQKMV